MLTPREQSLLDRHFNKKDFEKLPLSPIDVDLTKMTLRDLETYREATEFQMLQIVHEHFGECEVYMNRERDIQLIAKDEQDLKDLAEKLRFEKKKENKDMTNQLTNLLNYKAELQRNHDNDGFNKQRLATWKYEYFMNRIRMINDAIRMKQRTEVVLAFKLLIDSLLILIHAKKKPAKE